MKSGIYKIYNTVSDKAYIGSSENIKRRLKDHRVYLKNNTHPSAHLQNSYNKYGVSAFEYSIIEYCEISLLEEREHFWLSTIPNGKRYNQRLITKSNRGMKWSEDAKKKLKGRTPWNTGLKGFFKPAYSIKKGDRISVKTEFKKGCLPHNKGTKGIVKEDVIDGNRRKIEFSIVSPDNILYEGVCLKWFTDEMGILFSNTRNVLVGKASIHRGWRLPRENDVYNGYGSFLK